MNDSENRPNSIESNIAPARQASHLKSAPTRNSFKGYDSGSWNQISAPTSPVSDPKAMRPYTYESHVYGVREDREARFAYLRPVFKRLADIWSSNITSNGSSHCRPHHPHLNANIEDCLLSYLRLIIFDGPLRVVLTKLVESQGLAANRWRAVSDAYDMHMLMGPQSD